MLSSSSYYDATGAHELARSLRPRRSVPVQVPVELRLLVVVRVRRWMLFGYRVTVTLRTSTTVPKRGERQADTREADVGACFSSGGALRLVSEAVDTFSELGARVEVLGVR